MKTTKNDIMVTLTPENGVHVEPIETTLNNVSNDWAVRLERMQLYVPVTLSEMDGDYWFMRLPYDDFKTFAERLAKSLKR